MQRKATEVIPEGGALSINKLSVSYPGIDGAHHVLRNVSLAVEPGSILQVNGSNGSGKTTLLKALTNQIAGTGAYGIPVGNSQKALKRQRRDRTELIAFVPQHSASATAGSLSIAEHACLARCAPHLSAIRSWRKAARSAVPLLKIEDVTDNPDTLLQWLSGGQMRRVLIGLINARQAKPIVVAMDEPFSYLDAQGKLKCEEAIYSLARENRIVLLVDHGNSIVSTEIVSVDAEGVQ